MTWPARSRWNATVIDKRASNSANKKRLTLERLETRRLLVSEIESNDIPAQATAFANGPQKLEGSLASSSDVDWFKTTLNAGDRLLVGLNADDLSGSASKIPRYEIQDATGRVWATSNVGRTDGFTAVVSGTYFVGLFRDNIIQDYLGTYSVATTTVSFTGTSEAEPNDSLALATTLGTNELFSGSLATIADADVWAVDLKAGDSLGLRFSGASGPVAELLSPSGATIASGSGGIGLATVVDAPGRYLLKLSSGVRGFVGNYQGNLVRSARGAAEGGNSFSTASPLKFIYPLPSAALGTTAAFTTSGLVGSYVNRTLRNITSADWRTSQTIAGTRVDPLIKFETDGWGRRSDLNLTSGTDDNWDDFSVQWDGFIRISSDGSRLATVSDDGSRFWIDANRNGIFEDTPAEYVSNGWGNGQGVTQGPLSSALSAGTYAIRIQYEEGFGANRMSLIGSAIQGISAPITNTAESAAGLLSTVGEVDYYKVELDANQRYGFQLSSQYNSLFPRPGKSLASDGRRISIYNEFGQWLESSYSDATLANYFFARPEVTGTHYVLVECLTFNGLGGYSLSLVNEPFSSERLTPIVYMDYSQHAQSNLNDIVSAGIRAIYSPFQAEVTTVKPASGQEFVQLALRPDAGGYCGGLAGGQYGFQRPNGDGFVGRGTTCGSWNSFSQIWYDGMLHELGHTLGVPHAYHPRTGATIFPIGSYLVNYTFPGYTTPVLQQERRYVDWIEQAGAQVSEVEPNDSSSASQNLNTALSRMQSIGTVTDDQVVVSGRIDSQSDRDWYTLTLAAGQLVALDVDSAEHQLGLDSTLAVLDASGNPLIVAADSLDRESQIVSQDPFLMFRAPSAGDYRFVIDGQGLSTGAYRLKITPEAAMDKTAPRVYNVWPQPNTPIDETRQIVLWVDDLLDPDTLNSQTFSLKGDTTGDVSGSFAFDPLDSTVIFTANSKLRPDTYTLTLKSGGSGVRDLWGNPIDGETGGQLAFPAVSGNGIAGGDFVTKVRIGSTDTTPATVTGFYAFPAEDGTRDAANRLFFNMGFSDELDIVSVTKANWQLRGTGADGLMDTPDDQLQPLDAFFNKQQIEANNSISLYALGNAAPGSYRFEADLLDAAGQSVAVRYTTFLGKVAPASIFYQDSARTKPGLVGSYFNLNLRNAGAETDWRATRPVSGTRIDPQLNFTTGNWGNRSQTGITGGGSDWDNFSVQWDGFVDIRSHGTQLATSSDDGSRLWIDVNLNGIFETNELANNHFGTGQPTTIGDPSRKLNPGVYPVRIQYEEGGGGNDMFLLWSPVSTELGWQRTHFAPVITGVNIPSFTNLNTPFNEIVVRFGSDVNPATLTTANFKVRYSPNESFFDSDDQLVPEADGVVSWNSVTRSATWTPLTSPKSGYYLVELSGEAGGIASPNGSLLDGEYIDSRIPGGGVFYGWQTSPSGDSTPGGSYRWTFTLENPLLKLSIDQSTISENGGTALATVSRNTSTLSALQVNVSSSDATAATAPTVVTIPAGASATTFTVQAVNDSIADGSQVTTFTVSVPGLESDSTQLTVTDDEVSALALTFSASSMSENSGSLIGTITRNTPTVASLTVDLSVSRAGTVSVPASVTIPVGAASATFTATAINNTVASGNQTVNVTAIASGFTFAQASINLIDDETATLSLILAESTISENGGRTQATVTRNTATTNALSIVVTSSDVAAATVPSAVTIPAGAASVSFDVTAVNDSLADGNQLSTVTTSALGFAPGSAQIIVVDDEASTLTLVLASASVIENAGSVMATLSRNTSVSAPLTVSLSSNNPSAATVPTSVTIPSGASSTTFPVTLLDNTLASGTQFATIDAVAATYAPGRAQLTIVDDEVAGLTLSISNERVPEGGSTTVTVTRNTPTTANLMVTLSSSAPIAAVMPSTIIIPSGETSVSFNFDTLEDVLATGDQSVTIGATAIGLVEASLPLTIVENDSARLGLSLTVGSLGENGGASQATVTRNTPVDLPLLVLVNIGISGRINAPSSVTIPSGASSGTILLTAMNNSLADGDLSTTLTVSASGLSAATASVIVLDDESPALALMIVDNILSELGGSTRLTVSRNSATTTELIVTLNSSLASQINLPNSISIPVGQASSSLTLSTIDDRLVEASQLLVITASTAGFTSAESRLTVEDDDRLWTWNNTRNTLDVNDDTFITALDALLIINDLNSTGSRSLSPVAFGNVTSPPYLDTNTDGFSTPLDALLVINYLNNRANSEGEYESTIQHDLESAVDLALSDLATERFKKGKPRNISHRRADGH